MTNDVNVHCACGASFQMRSTKAIEHIDIHPDIGVGRGRRELGVSGVCGGLLRSGCGFLFGSRFICCACWLFTFFFIFLFLSSSPLLGFLI